MFVLSVLMSVGLAATPEVTLSWDRAGVMVQVSPPAGEKIAVDAPASLALQWTGGRLSFEGDGNLFVGPLPVLAPRGASLVGELSLSLCLLDGSECRAGTWDVSVVLPRDRRGEARFDVGRESTNRDRPAVNHFGNGADAQEMVMAAKSRAAENETLVLLDFSAVWCPPCNMLAAEVLDAGTAREDLAGFELVVIDADDPSSFAVKDRYDVGGYPTVLVVEPDGHERARTVGYTSRTAFLSWLASAKSPVSEVVVLDESANRLAKFQADGTIEDLLWLTEHHDDPTAYAYQSTALTSVNELAADAVVAAVARALLTAEGVQTASLLDIAAGLSDTPEPLYAAAVSALASTLTGNPAMDKAVTSWLATLTAGAGDTVGAHRVLRDAQSQWPDEPTFYMANARLHREMGQFEPALGDARLAVDRAWGDNKLRAVGLVARILADLGRQDEARDLINQTLASTAPPTESQKVRAHRYREQLLTIIEDFGEDAR